MTQMSEPDVVIAAYSRWLNSILETHAKQLWDAADDGLDDDELRESWELDQWRNFVAGYGGLSADLFSLVDNEKFTDTDWEPIPKQELAENVWRDLSKSESGTNCLIYCDGHHASLPVIKASYLRGRAWQELGQHHVALKFFDNASRLKPGHAPYQILALECLRTAGDWHEALGRAH